MKHLLFIILSLIALYSPGFSLSNLKKLISMSQLRSEKIQVINVFPEKESSQFVALLPKGTVVNEGGILTEKGYILEDTKTSLLDQHRLTKPNRDIDNENPLFFKGRLAVISSPGSENWYHWLLQILPRLIILSQSQIEYDRIYINNVTQSWQKDSLKIVLAYLKIPEEKLLIINGDCLLQADTLIVPSVPFRPFKEQALPHWLKKELRKIFLTHTKIDAKKYERIYISRKNALSRHITNEKELIEKLKGLDFKTIELETLSSYEQAQIFHSARIIVGPHGSGFANLIFVRPHCKIIEIDHGTLPTRSFYKNMTSLMCSSYYPFFVDQVSEDHLEDDMKVDIPEFMQFLKKIILLKNVYLCSDLSLYA